MPGQPVGHDPAQALGLQFILFVEEFQDFFGLIGPLAQNITFFDIIFSPV